MDMHININLMKMLQVSDSYFPIGAYTLSNGLETFIQKGIVKDIKTLDEYIDNFLKLFPYNDLGFIRFAFEYCKEENFEALIKLDKLCTACKGPSEIRMGSIKLGTRFIKVAECMGQGQLLNRYKIMIKDKVCAGHHAITLGIFAYENNIDLDTCMTMYGYSTLSAIVNNATKMVPLSQLKGQALLAEVSEKLIEVVEKTNKIEYNQLGLSMPSFDIRAMEHERLYSRLYMS